MAADLAVATYNIHRAVGADGICDLARIATVLREVDAAVVGVQEIDCHATDNPSGNQLERLAELTRMHGVAGPLVRRLDVSTGNGILSRFPIRERRWIDLSVKSREPRGALDVDLDTPFGPLRVVNTHLGLRYGERSRQIELLFAAVDATTPTIVLGDFNEWRWRAKTLLRLQGTYAGTPPLRSFPARRPFLALDRVYVHPREALVGAQVVATETARRASDHLPLRAILKLALPPSGVLQTESRT